VPINSDFVILKAEIAFLIVHYKKVIVILISQTLGEQELELGENLKRLRLNKNCDQKTLAARAGISVRALRNLETGQGSSLKTLLSVVRALGREAWLQTIAPVATINPLTLTSRASKRLRATSPNVKANAAKQRVVALRLAEKDDA
jgi:transcriptional regulator with XRE-family HTH domain